MFSERQVSILTSKKDDNDKNISGTPDDSQRSKAGDSNIDNFFAQFDKISNKFETKPLEDSMKSKLEGKAAIGSSKPKIETDSVSRIERLKNLNKSNFFSELVNKLTLLLLIIKSFYIRFASKVFLEKSDEQTNSETGTETGAAMGRNSKRKKPGKYRVNKSKLLKFILIIFLVFVLIVSAFTISVILKAPKIDPNNIYSLLSESSMLYDSEGNVIDSVVSGEGSRTNVEFSALAPDLVHALVAVEDKTFWKHNGFNYVRIFGAISESIFSGDNISGTSTITQQLARNLYLSERKSDYDITRKIAEAYYTMQLESHLNKEQILEAYLNTIFLGYNSNGVQAASQAYFSKDVQDLSLIESVALAALPKAPDSYALVKRIESDKVDPDNENIIYKGDTFTYIFNDASKDRRELILKFMTEQGYISEEQKNEAAAVNLKDVINPSTSSMSEISSYFADYVISEVTKDLGKELNLSPEEARQAVYNNGLRIFTTMESKTQKIVEEEFTNPKNFPGVTNLKKDNAGNILNENGKVLLYSYNNYFNEANDFILNSDEYKLDDNGDLILFDGKRLNFYKTEVKGDTEFSIEFKNMYQVEDGTFYNIGGGVIIVPQTYKTRDNDGNLIISAQFFEDNPDYFNFSDQNITITSKHYTLRQKVIQPQSSMVITEPGTGAIRAMVGGRDTVGRLLFNRATSPRQPGSSVKPIGVYGPAIQISATASESGKPQSFSGDTSALFGDYLTAGSVIDDAPLTVQGKLWPSNWYSGYRGLNTLRVSIEQSINVNAVRVFQEVGVAKSMDFMKKVGITSIVEDGDTNDKNAAALALGGMTVGISPLEMAGAYGSFVNKGKYVEPVSYTRIENKRGEVILERIPEERQAMDKDVAFIMTDMLRSTVQHGIAASASIGSQPVAGKTGTTTDNFDAWFVGFTPQYVGAIWIGNDVNIELTQGSTASARLFSKIMRQVCADIPSGSFPSASKNIIRIAIDSKSGMLPSSLSSLDTRGTVINEYFIKGTEPKKVDSIHVLADICNDSGYLATPLCTSVSSRVGIKRPYNISNVGDMNYEVPHYYCNIHNPNPEIYPINPDGSISNFTGPSVGGDKPTGKPDKSSKPGITTDPAVDDGGTIPDWLNP